MASTVKPIEWPTAALLLAVASLAVGSRFVLPELFGGQARPWSEPLQHAALLAALVFNALRYGRNPDVLPWPAFVATLFLALAPWVATSTGNGPGAGPWPGHALAAWVALVLPWCAVGVRLQPQSERRLAMFLASMALISAAVGLLLHHFSEWSAYRVWNGTLYRFAGATRADYFAGLAWGGVVIGLHEWFRRRSRLAGLLATVNAALLIFSGSRTGLLATGVWFVVYLLLSRNARGRRAMPGPGFWLALGAVAVAFAIHFPVLRDRMFELDAGTINLSGRGQIWESLFAHFRTRPWLGWGLGTTQPGGFQPVLPHNEFLRLMVDLGIIGGALYLGAILLWIRRVLEALGDDDRPYVLALVVALAVYSLTDNPISACYVLPFLYLGSLVSGRAGRDVPAVEREVR